MHMALATELACQLNAILPKTLFTSMDQFVAEVAQLGRDHGVMIKLYKGDYDKEDAPLGEIAVYQSELEMSDGLAVVEYYPTMVGKGDTLAPEWTETAFTDTGNPSLLACQVVAVMSKHMIPRRITWRVLVDISVEVAIDAITADEAEVSAMGLDWPDLFGAEASVYQLMPKTGRMVVRCQREE